MCFFFSGNDRHVRNYYLSNSKTCLQKPKFHACNLFWLECGVTTRSAFVQYEGAPSRGPFQDRQLITMAALVVVLLLVEANGRAGDFKNNTFKGVCRALEVIFKNPCPYLTIKGARP